MGSLYKIKETKDISSPCLIYYEDIIRTNIEKAIEMAGTPERLWPHVKSHKSADMIRLQMEYGINKFKTATVAEAEMAAAAGARQVILAYPLIGPNMERFVKLSEAYPETVFYAIGDDEEQFELLSDVCAAHGMVLPALVDVNMGMNRTGVDIGGLEELYRSAAGLPGISLCGMHCYDGNHNNRDIAARTDEVAETDAQVMKIIESLKADDIACEYVVAGGTPSFPCRAGRIQEYPYKSDGVNWYLSPGTALITDAGYYKNLPELAFVPGAAVMTRVVSHPAKGIFTTDLGYKGIASDPPGQRGYIVGFEDAEPVIHSEEHWAFRMEDESRLPMIGECLYVIPTHICPTSALYPEVLVAKDGVIADIWKITARNRKITY